MLVTTLRTLGRPFLVYKEVADVESEIPLYNKVLIIDLLSFLFFVFDLVARPLAFGHKVVAGHRVTEALEAFQHPLH